MINIIKAHLLNQQKRKGKEKNDWKSPYYNQSFCDVKSIEQMSVNLLESWIDTRFTSLIIAAFIEISNLYL